MELKIFLVEDFDGMRSLLAEVFSLLQHVRLVGTAKTAAEAISWLDENTTAWDVLIIDLVLDQGSGMEVIQHARRNPGKGKIVVLSSFVTPAIRAHCTSLGADAVYNKTEAHVLLSWLAAKGKPTGE